MVLAQLKMQEAEEEIMNISFFVLLTSLVDTLCLFQVTTACLRVLLLRMGSEIYFASSR
jgi:hypothetical protein